MDLIARYTAYLPTQSQVDIYAGFLQNITDKQAQRRCLQLAQEVRWSGGGGIRAHVSVQDATGSRAPGYYP